MNSSIDAELSYVPNAQESFCRLTSSDRTRRSTGHLSPSSSGRRAGRPSRVPVIHPSVDDLHLLDDTEQRTCYSPLEPTSTGMKKQSGALRRLKRFSAIINIFHMTAVAWSTLSNRLSASVLGPRAAKGDSTVLGLTANPELLQWTSILPRSSDTCLERAVSSLPLLRCTLLWP